MLLCAAAVRRAAPPASAALKRGAAAVVAPARRGLAEQVGGYMRTGEVTHTESRVLVTGATGQIGQELVPHLRELYGAENVIATDVKSPPRAFFDAGPFHYLDVLQADQLARVSLEHGVDVIVHLAALLSAVGERNPQLALQINSGGTQNVLELARLNHLEVYIPSSIAVFGPSTPRDPAPDPTIMRPTTMYGVTKVYGELLGDYYYNRYGTNYRALRYPGVVSYKALAGGGTTDYAVDIYYKALTEKRYTCFLREDTVLPMMYMPDLLNATSSLMLAPNAKLSRRTYNLGAMSFTPADLAASIRKHIPEFEIEYAPDFRQDIADTWPQRIDDTAARLDWNWAPKYDIDAMTEDMLTQLDAKLKAETAAEADTR